MYIAWSMKGLSERVFDTSHNDVSCIICYETDKTKQTDWHRCWICSATWCDSCMEQMYNAARDSEDIELACPQCRGSIASMQLKSRISHITATIGCSSETARAIVNYENLLTETVHLCECEEDGQPYFMVAPASAARVMSRDPICQIVSEKQGHAEDSQLRRMLRSADYSGAIELVLKGYVHVLRSDAQVPSASPYIESLAEYLTEMRNAKLSSCADVADSLLPIVTRVVEAEREAERAAAHTASSEAARPRRRRRGSQHADSEDLHQAAGGIRKRPTRLRR
mmetsp:Transcript_6313/g.10673  ORF Transcript_6313/g.10673 Transcript_6313/m.10673 type:complete len:282 (-) Transcript_6313:184-1029(-)